MSDDRLLQEILLEQDPTGWRMMVGCILLNQTGRHQVDQVWPKLFQNFSTPYDMARAAGARRPDALVELIQPLGLQNRRALTLTRFSDEWWGDAHDPVKQGEKVLDMRYPGLGEYAHDSWMIFKMKKRDFVPEDKELKKYLGLEDTDMTKTMARMAES